MSAAATAAVRGGNTPPICTALDALACLSADEDNDNKFADVMLVVGGEAGEVARGPAVG